MCERVCANFASPAPALAIYRMCNIVCVCVCVLYARECLVVLCPTCAVVVAAADGWLAVVAASLGRLASLAG